MIRSYADDRWLGIEQASEAANTSVRTMQRRLSAQQKNYSSIIQETRAEMAGDLLEGTDASMAEIAHMLGYRHQGDFTHAFRRWAKVSPSEFRKHRSLKD
jgi:AraC-like DNA-binding protein